MVQFGSELQWGRRIGPLDGHEGVPTGAGVSLAHFGAVIAKQVQVPVGKDRKICKSRIR